MYSMTDMLMQDKLVSEYIQPRDREKVYGSEFSITFSIALCSVLLGSMWFPRE